jgi:hypothetical protein
MDGFRLLSDLYTKAIETRLYDTPGRELRFHEVKGRNSRP